MFRVLLTIAMLWQVAACPVNCAFAVAPQAAKAQPPKQSCSCCPARQTSQESVPSDQGEDEDCGDCFCNGAASTSVQCDLGLFLDSNAIWTAVDRHLPSQAMLELTARRTPWLSGDGTGIGLRLAVHSLLL